MKDKTYLLIETKRFWPIKENSIIMYEGFEEVKDKPDTYLIKLRVIGDPV